MWWLHVYYTGNKQRLAINDTMQKNPTLWNSSWQEEAAACWEVQGAEQAGESWPVFTEEKKEECSEGKEKVTRTSWTIYIA